MFKNVWKRLCVQNHGARQLLGWTYFWKCVGTMETVQTWDNPSLSSLAGAARKSQEKEEQVADAVVVGKDMKTGFKTTQVLTNESEFASLASTASSEDDAQKEKKYCVLWLDLLLVGRHLLTTATTSCCILFTSWDSFFPRQGEKGREKVKETQENSSFTFLSPHFSHSRKKQTMWYINQKKSQEIVANSVVLGNGKKYEQNLNFVRSLSLSWSTWLAHHHITTTRTKNTK